MVNDNKSYNKNFEQLTYLKFLNEIESNYGPIPFRIAESPFFISEDLKTQLIEAGQEIINFIKSPNFNKLTQSSIPPEWNVPNQNAHPHFLALDFAITETKNGQLQPKLIELQGFPSLFGFQDYLAEMYKKHFNINTEMSPYFGDFDKESMFNLLKKVIVGDHYEKNVVLLDVDAHHQKTLIDFKITCEALGIEIVALEEVFEENNDLYYLRKNEKIQIKRIYNRLIFDEIESKPHLRTAHLNPTHALNVEWITHPNWFYRVSKYILPYLKGKYFPQSDYLNNVINNLPDDLSNYIIKPLMSFGGKGVIIDVSKEIIDDVDDPENWILQEKVDYAQIIPSPNGNAKVELRLMYIWPDNQEPQLCINLARLSKGKMIGVNYNKDLNWVGGSVGLMR